MSSITVTVSGSATSSAQPTWRYWQDGSTYYREGIRDGKIVKDKYLSGGSLTLFKSGAGVKGTDYELISQES